MENNLSVIRELSICIASDFNIEQRDMERYTELKEVKKRLTEIIHYLLHHDMQKLLSVFYRMDLDENRVNAIIHLAPPENIAEELAELTLQRELQKVETRRKYRNFS
jgi:hypothetical protein